jgi:hypothetical protein
LVVAFLPERGIVVQRGVDSQRDLFWSPFDGSELTIAATSTDEEFVALHADTFVFRRPGSLWGAQIGGVPYPLVVSSTLESAYTVTPVVDVTAAGRLVYITDPHGYGAMDIHSIGVDGSAPADLAATEFFYERPVGIAGERVVFETDPDPSTVREILAIDADGTNPAVLQSVAVGRPFRTRDLERCASAPELPYHGAIFGMLDRLIYLRLIGDPLDDEAPWNLESIPLAGGPFVDLGAVNLNGIRCRWEDRILVGGGAVGLPLVLIDPITGEGVEVAPDDAFPILMYEGRLFYTVGFSSDLFSASMTGGDEIEVLPSAFAPVVLGAAGGRVVVGACNEDDYCDVYSTLPDGTDSIPLFENVYRYELGFHDGWLVEFHRDEIEPARVLAASVFGHVLDITPPDLTQQDEMRGFFAGGSLP